MTNYQELKRLAEAAKLELADIANVVIEDGDLSHHELFQSLASPDVVLGLIKSLEHTTMAAEAEAKEVDERNAVIAGLRTQNQALMEALERMVESVTGVDQVSAVNEARAALTAAKQAQPPAPSDTAITYMTGYSDGKEWAGATNLAQPERAPLTESEISKLVMPYGFSSIQGFDHIKAYTRRVEAYIKQGGQHD